MIKIGMMIADRYEILEKVGTGGMSDVYKAHDHKLSRPVAVKVLKQEFSENENFVSKFRVEAQAAAGLLHPNIVNVYDVGEENGIHYIVMQLVEGYTLKVYIEKKVRISVRESLIIAIRIAQGIEAAHKNHIIHRDIKPQNVIISNDGEVKVTDFGIAKAATSNTITSNVMGSVHYTSPEQARGGYSDERSDIYSLGITLYEMLTGRLPFNGETTVAIAIKHIQEQMPAPGDIVGDIPYCVDDIVLKCCQKSPDRRYQSMAELIEDLKRAYTTPEEDFVRITNPDEESATRNVTEEDMEQIRRKTAKSVERDADLRLNEAPRKKKRQHTKDSYQEDYYQDDYYPEDDYQDKDYYPEDKSALKTDKLITVLAIIAAVLIGVIVIFFVGKSFGLFGTEDSNVSSSQGLVPEGITGVKMDVAKKVLIEAGLTPEIQYEESKSVEEGIVLRSSPLPGEEVAAGTTVILTVSAGETGVDLPDVTSLSQAEAKSNLEQRGFQVTFVEKPDEKVEVGYVISMSPEGNTSAPAGSAITVYVSSGSTRGDMLQVPDLYGRDEMDAILILHENGLESGDIKTVETGDEALDGKIIWQSIPAGTYAAKGTIVELQVGAVTKSVTYKFEGDIGAPTEDPDYHAGTSVLLTLTAADGKQLLSTTISDFPYHCKYTGLNAASGTITLVFDYTKEGEVVTDMATGETYTMPGDTITKSVKRDVSFTQE